MPDLVVRARRVVMASETPASVGVAQGRIAAIEPFDARAYAGSRDVAGPKLSSR